MRQFYVGENQTFWSAQLKSQSGGGFYIGRKFQRGGGIGSILAGLFRSAVTAAKPIAKSAIKDIARTGISTLSETLKPDGDPRGVLERGLKKTARKTLKKTGRKIGKKRQKGGRLSIKGVRKRLGAISSTKRQRPSFII